MRIDVAQPIAVSRDRVVAAFLDPAWYASLHERPGLGAPEPLSLVELDGVVHTSVRWRYAGTLPPAAARLIETEKLTWVIEMRLDAEHFTGSLHVVPDHYEGLLTCEATVAFDSAVGTTTERVNGELAVKIPLFGDTVERAISKGFEEHLRVEAEALGRFCA